MVVGRGGGARCIIERTQTADEGASLPLREGGGWIQRLRELQLLRKPLTPTAAATQIYATRDKTTAYHMNVDIIWP